MDAIGDMKKYILGKILTIVEASTDDREKRKALKDIIMNAVWQKEYHTNRILGLSFDVDDDMRTPDEEPSDIIKLIRKYTNDSFLGESIPRSR